MIVECVIAPNMFATNTYFYIDEISKHGFLIDPADNAPGLLDVIKRNQWIIEKILITHGHFDHLGAIEEIHQALNIPYYIHINGKDYLQNPEYNLSGYFGQSIILKDASYTHDGDIIELEGNKDVKFKVIYTPGHTTDGVVYYDEANHLAFVGDTIFKSSIGRTDFYGGSTKDIYESIRHKILTLPDDTTLYCGHGEKTTIKAEKKYF